MPTHLVLPLLAWSLLLAGPLLTRSGIWPWWVGFASCAGAGLIGLFLLLRLPWRRSRISALIGALPLLVPLWFLGRALTAPLQNDVATDPRQPPSLAWAIPLRGKGDLPITLGPLQGFADNPGPLYSKAPPAQVLATARQLVVRRGWQLYPNPQGLAATATSPWFGFRDDISLRIHSGREVRVDMRSASRIGRSDLGTNRARIVNFLRELEQALAHQAPGAATTQQ